MMHRSHLARLLGQPLAIAPRALDGLLAADLTVHARCANTPIRLDVDRAASLGLPIYARQIARPDGSAIEVKTEASILPVNKRPRLAVRIFSSN